ncbi:MAG: acyl-CoA reductase [Lachnospiraceae bacterium]
MKDEIQYLAGVIEPLQKPLQPFSTEAVEALSAIAEGIRREESLREYKEIAAFGFWCRRAHLQQMKEKWGTCRNSIGRGLVFHLAPSNVPVLFAYSYAIGLLAGNANIVRLSTRSRQMDYRLCRLIQEVLLKEEHREILIRTCILTYPQRSGATEQFFSVCDGRVIWGGDATIEKMRAIPAKPHSVEAVFSDRESFCILNVEKLARFNENEWRELAHGFYNDTYGMDQNACSSPKLIIWVTGQEEQSECARVQKRWWNEILLEAENYPLEAYQASKKYELLCEQAMTSLDMEAVQRYNNRLYVSTLNTISDQTLTKSAQFGMFYQYETEDLQALKIIVTSKVQTLTYGGFQREELLKAVLDWGLVGIDRIVPVGQGLNMDPVWDGIDLIRTLSRLIG